MRLLEIATLIAITVVFFPEINHKTTATLPALQNPTTPHTPHYYYNRETAFLVNHAIDQTNGGLYLATDANGNLVDISGVRVWNDIVPSGTMSDIKTTSAQAMGILYFIREYHRMAYYGIQEFNNLIDDPARRLSDPVELLTIYAKNLADFATNGNPFKMSDSDQSALGGNSNKLFYYGYTQADGSGGMPDGTNGAGNPESLLPWTLAELSLVMSEAGVATSVYQPYIDKALEWWNWRKNQGVHVPYGYGQNSNYGAGKDVYYGALGLTLFELTSNVEYKDGGGNMADGQPLGALPYMYNALGNPGNNPNLGNPPAYAVQDGAYVSGYGRGICYAKAEQRAALGMNDYSERQPFQEFGFSPLYERGNSYPNYDINTTAELLSIGIDPSAAFEHFKGREIFAGTQRTLWFNYSFQINGGMFYADNGSNPNYPTDFTTSKQAELIYDYWNYCHTAFWDDTDGVAAWVENTGAPTYKPCFSGGVDVPIADWKAPSIGGKSHTWSEGTAATIEITNVIDENWDFVTWKFDDIGLQSVEVLYSTDNGANWQIINATSSGGDNYTATIPSNMVTAAHDAGHDLYYFIRAADNFGNYEISPTGTQIVKETGLIDANGQPNAIDKSQACVIVNPNAPVCPTFICNPIQFMRSIGAGNNE